MSTSLLHVRRRPLRRRPEIGYILATLARRTSRSERHETRKKNPATLGGARLCEKRRAWDSNPQPLAGHLISSPTWTCVHYAHERPTCACVSRCDDCDFPRLCTMCARVRGVGYRLATQFDESPAEDASATPSIMSRSAACVVGGEPVFRMHQFFLLAALEASCWRSFSEFDMNPRNLSGV